MIKTQTYLFKPNLILSNGILSAYVSRFWNEVFTTLIPNKEMHLMILCKVQYSDTNDELAKSYKTLGPLRRVEYKDKELFIEYLTERLGILIDSYNSHSISKLVFTYIVKEGKISTNDRLLLQDLTDKSLSFHNFNKIKLPISMNPSDYGKILTKEVINNITRYITTVNKRIFQIDVSLDNLINHVSILGSSDFSWTDTLLADGTIKREIGKSTIYFLDGEIVLQKKELNAKSFRRLRSG